MSLRHAAFSGNASRPAEVRPSVSLQLSAARGQLSLELQRPATVGPLIVQAMAMSLPGLRFPIDLTGGVARFRHRRGQLELLCVELPLGKAAELLASRIRHAGDWGLCSVTIAPTAHGLAVGVQHDERALAFTGFFVSEGDSIRWIVANARGIGLDVPSHAAALRVAQALFGKLADRRGSVFVMDRAVVDLVREVLIDAGARTPILEGVQFTSWEETAEGIRVTAQRGAVPLAPSPLLLRAVELGRLAEEGDNALADGDTDRARIAYLKALERAPRHPELSLRLAEIDLVVEHSTDAALATLAEAMPVTNGGLVASRLLAARGDREAALTAARRAADAEPYAPLAALALCVCAAHTQTTLERLDMLDEAVARAPWLVAGRWKRAHARLGVGNVRGACADLEHIWTLGNGAHEKFDRCLGAGRMLLEHRAPLEATRFFERALRYVPASADASAGLARALLDAGQGPRATALLSRAVTLAARSEPPFDLVLELAMALATIAKDLPAAIAQVRSIPYGCSQSVAARALEGRWRAMLGDVVGASVAFGQAREIIQLLPSAPNASCADYFVEAGRFEMDIRGDSHAAQQHLMAALRFRPQDTTAQGLFRAASDRIAAGSQPRPDAIAREPSRDRLVVRQPGSPELHSADESRIEELTHTVRANPSDFESIVELCRLLDRAGRDMDLFALVSARLEETAERERRDVLSAYRRSVLARLARTSREEGRLEEAKLYEQAITSGDPAPA